MADTLTPMERSERMSRVRGKNTGPEVHARKVVHSLGYRFRLHSQDLPGRPDMVLRRHGAVIFVHGCFWHRHSELSCPLARWPKSRLSWKPKLEGNRLRDLRIQEELVQLGWRVLVVWECELREVERVEWKIRSFLDGGQKGCERSSFCGCRGTCDGSQPGGLQACPDSRARQMVLRHHPGSNRARRVAPVARWPKPFEDDISLVDFTPHDGTVDIVTGGPPCQPFSIGGRHLAHDDHRDMWVQAVRALREARPRAFIFENVKGLTRQTFADYLGYILLQLQYPSSGARRQGDLGTAPAAAPVASHTRRGAGVSRRA